MASTDDEVLEGGTKQLPNELLGIIFQHLQMRQTMRAELDLDELMAAGNFEPILQRLREHIHSQGSIREGDELMREVIGRPLGHEAFMEYLRAQYRPLSGL